MTQSATMTEQRFFIDHGMIHDRVTGKPGEKARAVLTALANAAPAQVESGK